MSDELAGMGDLATGAGIARAVEPHSGEHGAGAHAQTRCLNCGTFLMGSHCHRCGQVGHIHRTVGAFGHDLAHSVLHFEGKFWRTLPLLAFRPGELTRRYIEGERAQFISPLALFLFCVFLTFAVFSLVGGNGTDDADGYDVVAAAETQSRINQAERLVADELASAETALAALRATGQDVRAAERALAERRAAARTLRLDGREEPGDEARETFVVTDLRSGFSGLDQLLARMNDNPSLMLYKFQNYAYKYGWGLIPLSAPFLWLLYPFSRRFGWYDHLVFVTYSLCFMLLLVVALRVASALGMHEGVIIVVALLYPPWHIYRQVRGAYRSSRIGSLIRTVILVCVGLCLLFAFGMALLALGAIG